MSALIFGPFPARERFFAKCFLREARAPPPSPGTFAFVSRAYVVRRDIKAARFLALAISWPANFQGRDIPKDRFLRANLWLDTQGVQLATSELLKETSQKYRYFIRHFHTFAETRDYKQPPRNNFVLLEISRILLSNIIVIAQSFSFDDVWPGTSSSTALTLAAIPPGTIAKEWSIISFLSLMHEKDSLKIPEAFIFRF